MSKLEFRIGRQRTVAAPKLRNMRKGYPRDVQRMYNGCTRDVQGMYKGCTRDVQGMYKGCTRDVQGMYKGTTRSQHRSNAGATPEQHARAALAPRSVPGHGGVALASMAAIAVPLRGEGAERSFKDAALRPNPALPAWPVSLA